MIYYFVFFIVSFLFMIAGRSKHKGLYYAGTLLLIVLATFRADTVGIDVRVYLVGLYNKAKFSQDFVSFILSQSQEVLFSAIVYLGHSILGSMYGVFFIVACISIIPIVFVIIKMEEIIYPEIAIAYFCLLFYPITLNQMRQSMAMAILCLAFWFLNNKQYWKTVVVSFLAIGFHKSAIFVVAIFALWLWGKKIKKKVYYIFIILGLVGIWYWDKIAIYFMQMLPFLPRRYLDYMSSDYNFPLTYTIVYFIIAVWATLYYKSNAEDGTFWFGISIFCLMGGFVFARAAHLNRIFMYGQVFLTFFISKKNIPIIKDNRSNRIIVHTVFIMMFMLVFYYYNFVLNAYGIVPYELGVG